MLIVNDISVRVKVGVTSHNHLTVVDEKPPSVDYGFRYSYLSTTVKTRIHT